MLRLGIFFVFLMNFWSVKAFSQAKITVGDPYAVIDAKEKYYFTENGEVMTLRKTQILDTRDVQGIELFQFKPSRTLGTALNTLVFEAYKKKKEDVLVKVVLD